MATIESKTIASPVARRAGVEIIFASAKDALTSAMLVYALGGVAVEIAKGFAGEMIPSAPPGFGGTTHPGENHPAHHFAWHTGAGAVFGTFFTLFFVHSLWLGFRDAALGASSRPVRVLSHLREHWFSLIVGNAISAWVAAVILRCLPNFSLTQIFLHWLWTQMLPGLEGMAHSVFGQGRSTWSDWWSWYQGNSSKFYFWIIYLGGVIDDMGVPNFKTFARWGWRRLQKRKDSALATSSAVGDVG